VRGDVVEGAARGEGDAAREAGLANQRAVHLLNALAEVGEHDARPRGGLRPRAHGAVRRRLAHALHARELHAAAVTFSADFS